MNYKNKPKNPKPPAAVESTPTDTDAPPARYNPHEESLKKARANSPISRDLSPKEQDNADLGRKLMHIYNLPPIDNNDTEAIVERCIYYFEYCTQVGLRPGVEGLALALGTTRSTLNRWEHGERGTVYRDIVKKAKTYIADYLEALATTGKINPVTYIFLTKNNHGYKDQSEINVNIDTPLGDTVNPDTIAARLPDLETDQAGDVIDVDFKEV
jgi:transcriptional regulator with XRE-family HTH domain